MLETALLRAPKVNPNIMVRDYFCCPPPRVLDQPDGYNGTANSDQGGLGLGSVQDTPVMRHEEPVNAMECFNAHLVPLHRTQKDIEVQVFQYQLDQNNSEKADAATCVTEDLIRQEPRVPTAPPEPIPIEPGDELNSDRPAPPHWGRSSYAARNNKINSDFSHLPRFIPEFFTLQVKQSPWSRFLSGLREFLAKHLPFVGSHGKVSDINVEVELYYHLMLEMAYLPHTSKSLLMLKTKARRYLAQFDLSYLTSAEVYRIIFDTVLAAYFTAGQSMTINTLIGINGKNNTVRDYEEALVKLFDL